MRNIVILLSLALCSFNLFSQTIYEEFHSEKLGEKRKLKIQLPRNYESNTDKVYPIILVLDADYLFEPVAGNVDYFSYWEDMPESIVVGVMQADTRYEDCSYDDENNFPSKKGAKFFEFLGLELVPHIDEKYRTAKFIIAVGHDFTANFLNYYLFKNPPLFNGYINLSPDLAPSMESAIPTRIPAIKSQIFYYLATGTDDIEGLLKSAESLNEGLKAIDSQNFTYYYDNFEGATHYSLAARGIANALEKIFSVYRPISKKEYNDVLLKLETPIDAYLVEKYKTIEDLFGINNRIRVNDFIATASAAEKLGKLDALKEIASMARKQYPETMLGDYYLGIYYEKSGDLRKAMRTYQAAFDKEEVDFMTKDLLLTKAEEIKDKMQKE